MPRLHLKLTEKLGDDLTTVSKLGVAALAALGDLLSQHDPCLIKPADLRKAIVEALGAEAAPSIERVLLGLSGLRRQGHVSATELLDSLNYAIESENWDASRREGWLSIQEPLAKLLDSRSVIVTAKAVDLLYDYEHFFVSAKILTDVRPVFDEGKNDIVGAAINQTLRLEYTDGAGKRATISMSMDDDDIEWLKRSCEEALRKGEKSSKLVKEKWSVSTITVDEMKNERG